MSRVSEMARFQEPEDEVVVGFCVNCDKEIYEGNQHVMWETERFCDTDCLLESIDYSWE